MIKCAIFDADGTLLDTMPMWTSITYAYAEYKGIKVPGDLHRTMNRMSLEQCAECYQRLGAKGTQEEILREIVDFSMRGYREQAGEKPHAGAFLALLHQNGIHTAVATASELEAVNAAFARLSMLPNLDYVVTCTQVGRGKEYPDIFLRCAEKFNALPRECVVFEDSAYALKTARDAGFLTVAVEDAVSVDGLGAEESKAGLKALSNRYITDFEELIRELSPPEELGDTLSRAVGANEGDT